MIEEVQDPLPQFTREARRTSHTRRPRPPSPREIALHVYWSASIEAQAMAAAARSAPTTSERHALEALRQAELDRKAVAQRLLDSVWGLHLRPAPNEGTIAS